MSTTEPKVIADISMSLDGYVTGEGAGVGPGLGDAPEVHAWVMDQDEVDAEILATSTVAAGAVIMGRGLFDVVNAPDGLNEEMGYGADPDGERTHVSAVPEKGPEWGYAIFPDCTYIVTGEAP